MSKRTDTESYRQPVRQLAGEIDYRRDMDAFIGKAQGSMLLKMEHFPRFVPRQAMARYLALYEIFKHIESVHGDIVQCGVNWGGSLFAFAQFSTVMEPINLQRRIIGFDTFSGFTGIDKKDIDGANAHSEQRAGGYAADCEQELLENVGIFDSNRFLGHIPKISLVSGDACKTIPDYLERNPQLVVALLHLDFDVYEPTRVALQTLVSCMPRGGVIVFDELNHGAWPGETVAVKEVLGLDRLEIRRFAFEPFISYAIL